MTRDVISRFPVAAIHELRSNIIARLRVAGAISEDTAIQRMADLSPDQAAIFEELVSRGVIAQYRGLYYLDLTALNAFERPVKIRAAIGVAVVLLLVAAAMLWFLAHGTEFVKR